MYVQRSSENGSAKFTITVDGVDHRFTAFERDGNAIIEYDESHYSGRIRVSEPDQSVWRSLMQSDEMTAYLDENNLSGVRAKQHA